MATTTQNAPSFEEKIKGQIEDAKAKLGTFQEKGKEKRNDAETAAITKLNTAKQDLDRRLQDLKGTHQAYVARAKSEIETDTAKFKASVDEFGTKFKNKK